MISSKELIDAIEYIKKFRGQVFIVKFSGEIVEDDTVLDSVARDLILLNEVGIHPVVLHGAGNLISSDMQKLGLKPRFVKGERVTDEATMDIVVGCLQHVNNTIVGKINKYSTAAVGVTGGLFLARRRESLGLVGDIMRINTRVIFDLIEKGHIPVVFPVGADEEGSSLNINADIAAGELAKGLDATKLIVLTNVEGVYGGEGLIRCLSVSEARKLMESEAITGGMIPKLGACVDALSMGVKQAHIIKAGEHAILAEILTRDGTGTMIVG
jgi:acetylglutamate kinase